MRLLRVGDVELCVDEYGDPADPLVLLLGGAAASMDWWDVGFCEAIAAGGRRVVRYDHRDTGGSTTDPAGAPTYGGEALERDCVAWSRPSVSVPLTWSGSRWAGASLSPSPATGRTSSRR
jgi:pimeloyl-ACP methyl ester carboxylesterase